MNTISLHTISRQGELKRDRFLKDKIKYSENGKNHIKAVSHACRPGNFFRGGRHFPGLSGKRCGRGANFIANKNP